MNANVHSGEVTHFRGHSPKFKKSPIHQFRYRLRLLGTRLQPLRYMFQRRTLKEFPRLFREGWPPAKRLLIQAFNVSRITRLLRSDASVYFISSFPRSGNTWLRYLLADVHLQKIGHETTTDLPIEKLIPDFYRNPITARAVRHGVIHIKTHELYYQLQQTLFGAGSETSARLFRRSRHIYIYRSAEDSLVSLYHYYKRDKALAHLTDCGIEKFCFERISDWEDHVLSYLRARADGAAVFFVSYESLLKHPVEILSNLLRWHEVQHHQGMVHHAVTNMQFDNLRALEAHIDKQKALFFFRSGVAGSAKTELSPETIAAIQKRTGALFRQLRECDLHQIQQLRSSAELTAAYCGRLLWAAGEQVENTDTVREKIYNQRVEVRSNLQNF